MVYLIVQVVNFNTTIFDTPNLSVTRGASYAANLLPRYIIEKTLGKLPNDSVLRNAASACLVKTEGNPIKIDADIKTVIDTLNQPDSSVAKIQEDKTPIDLDWLIPHLCFVWAVSEKKNPKDALDEMSLTLAQRQSRLYSVDRPLRLTKMKGVGDGPCELDELRPCQTLYHLPAKQNAELSWSSALRRELGRSARRSAYYVDYLGVKEAKNYIFADMFDDIVANPPEGTPYRLRNKVCVFAMDMTGLGPKVKRAESTDLEYSSFSSNQVASQKGILAALTRAAMNNATLWQRKKRPDDHKAMLRLETLMVGGDECLAIFPSWCLEEAMIELGETAHTDFKFGSGFVIAPVKTPITQLRRMADELAEAAKGGKHDFGFQIHITGHIDTAPGNLTARRQAMFNIVDDNKAAKHLSLNLKEARSLFKKVRELKGTENDPVISRSALSRVLAHLAQSDFSHEPPPIEIGAGLLANTVAAESALGFGGTAALMHLAMLWQFVQPKASIALSEEVGT